MPLTACGFGFSHLLFVYSHCKQSFWSFLVFMGMKKKLEGLILWYVAISDLRSPSYTRTRIIAHIGHQLIYWREQPNKLLTTIPVSKDATNAAWVSEAHMTAGHDQEVGITGDA